MTLSSDRPSGPVAAPQQVQCLCGHDAGSHNALKFNCMATTGGTHATRCGCKAFTDADRPSGQTPRTGILQCHVYRNLHVVLYLDHVGAHPDLELDADILAGGDWSEADVVYEDSPPSPPDESGLWLMVWGWREPTEADFTGDEMLPRELCCLYDRRPTWTLLAPALEVPAHV